MTANERLAVDACRGLAGSQAGDKQLSSLRHTLVLEMSMEEGTPRSPILIRLLGPLVARLVPDNDRFYYFSMRVASPLVEAPVFPNLMVVHCIVRSTRSGSMLQFLQSLHQVSELI